MPQKKDEAQLDCHFILFLQIGGGRYLLPLDDNFRTQLISAENAVLRLFAGDAVLYPDLLTGESLALEIDAEAAGCLAGAEFLRQSFQRPDEV